MKRGGALWCLHLKRSCHNHAEVFVQLLFFQLIDFIFNASKQCFRKERNYRGSESHSPHQLRKGSHFVTEYRKAPPPQKGKEKPMGIRRVAGLA